MNAVTLHYTVGTPSQACRENIEMYDNIRYED
jgi:hypothetical protein